MSKAPEIKSVKNNHLSAPMPKEAFLAKLAATPQAAARVEAPLPIAELRIGDNPRRVNDRAVDAELRIGAVMTDGTVFAGISPDTGKPMYTTPADAPLTMTFNEAKEYAAKLDTHGYTDWRVPNKAELNVLFNNRAAIGGFNLTGSSPAGWYWSASQGLKWDAWDQRFSDGYQNGNLKVSHSTVRCVR
jgi:hypothetical protein